MIYQIPTPVPNAILHEIPLYCRVNPLERPRLNFLSKHVYQPLKNQAELLAEMALHADTYINEPVLVETFITHTGKHPPHVTAKEYGDLDNQAKAIHDAMVKCNIIHDDRLIVSATQHRAFGDTDFCLVRIWSVLPTTETFPWDFSTALISSKRPRPPEELWPSETPPSKSSRRARAKRRS